MAKLTTEQKYKFLQSFGDVAVTQQITENIDDKIASDGTEPFSADQSMGDNKLTDLAPPTEDTDAATKQYVDSAGGNAVWGGITGTLEDQTDLEAALEERALLNDDVSFLTVTASNTYAPSGKAGASATGLKTNDGLYGLEVATASGSSGTVTVLGLNNLKSGSGPGSLLWEADGAGDIGQSSDKRPATVYASTELNAPNLTTTGLTSNGGIVTIGEDSTTLEHVLNTATGTPASGVLTLTNGPSGKAGNATGYLKITVNGTTRYIPFW